MKLGLISTVLFLSVILVNTSGCDVLDRQGTNKPQKISLVQIGRYQTNLFDKGASKVSAYDDSSKQTFVVNGDSGSIDVLNTADLNVPSLSQSLDPKTSLVAEGKIASTGDAGDANFVATQNGLLAIAVEADTKTDNGWVLFFKASDLTFIKSETVGAQPTMLTFSPDGLKLLIANEGSPTKKNYAIDPEGSVSIIDLTWDGTSLTTNQTTIGFSDFNSGGSKAIASNSNILLNGALSPSVARDLEPEYITVSEDSKTAYVGLQENNAIAEIDLTNKTFTEVWGLGFKDHAAAGNELDGNHKDDAVDISSQPVLGMYMPNAIDLIEYQGTQYLLTANEGESRDDWIKNLNQTTCEAEGFYFNLDENDCMDEISMKDALDTSVLNPADNTTKLDFSQFDANGSLENAVERLKFSYSNTRTYGDTNNDNKIDKMLSFGGRSFSVWNTASNTLVYDSGKDFETITSQRYGDQFNQNNDEDKAEDRSDNKGPEPEGLVVGKIGEEYYAFIGLERMGGIMVYEVTNPTRPTFIEYVNNRILGKDPSTEDAGDMGPEGITFVASENSPNGSPMLIVSSDVSGTTTFYRIDVSF